MGKVLAGCLVVVVLVVAGGGTAGYLMFVKPYTDAIGSAARMAEEYAQIEASVQNRSTYRPPADGSLNEAQMQRLLAVQRSMRGQLEGSLDELQARYQTLQRELDASGREAGLREMFGAYRDLGDLFLTAKRAQVDALNAQGLSIEEYAWIRNQAYAALGQQVGVGHLAGDGAEAPVGRVPDTTVALVSPHQEELLELYVFAWFGL